MPIQGSHWTPSIEKKGFHQGFFFIEEAVAPPVVQEVEVGECGQDRSCGEPAEDGQVCPEPQVVAPLPVAESPLQVVFWNANGWNAQKCEQILETVKISGADMICISDARLDSFGRSYIEGYCKKLREATGKTWRKKLEARPERKPKCLIGGDIVFFSEECSKVSKTATSPYGTVSRINMLWKGAEVRVISVYRPYHGASDAIGSLRNAVTKLDPEFEDSFWDGALMHSDVPTLIGGDFNLGMKKWTTD